MKYMIQQQKKTARARAENVQVSSKQCIELCSFLRGKMLDRAIAILEQVIEKRQAVPFKRFTDGVGHRRGMAAGRYPVKAAAEFLVLLENVKANAANVGLAGNLKIIHLAAQRASRPVRNRLKYRGEFKRTHVEVVVAESEVKAKPATGKVEEKPATKPEVASEKKAPVKAEAAAKPEKKETPAKKEEAKAPEKKEVKAAPAAKPEEKKVEAKKPAEEKKEQAPAKPVKSVSETPVKEEKDGN